MANRDGKEIEVITVKKNSNGFLLSFGNKVDQSVIINDTNKIIEALAPLIDKQQTDLTNVIRDEAESVKTLISEAKKAVAECLSSAIKKSNSKDEEIEYIIEFNELQKRFDGSVKNLEGKLNDISKKFEAVPTKDEIIRIFSEQQCSQNESLTKSLTESLSNQIDELSKLARENNKLARENNKLAQKTIKLVQDNAATIQDNRYALANVSGDIDNILKILNEGKEKDKETAIDKAIVELNNQKNELDAENKRLSRLLLAAKSNGNTSSLPCPRCKVKTDRFLVNGECSCDVCGHHFTGINPDMSKESNDNLEEFIAKLDKDQITGINPDMSKESNDKELKESIAERYNKSDAKDGKQWRDNHTAVLEKVPSDNEKDSCYRMKLDEQSVSTTGILIIPQKDNEYQVIKKIDFCQPNTYDSEGRRILKKVKTLFLPEDVKLGKFDNKCPFSEIKNELQQVMRYSENFFSVDSDDSTSVKYDDATLKQIKGELA